MTLPRLLTVFLLSPTLLYAQTQAPGSVPTVRYVLPQGKGSLLPPTDGWQPTELSLLDNGTRFVIQLKGPHDLVASHILFRSHPGTATAEGCRQAVMPGVLKTLKANASVTEEPPATRTNADGRTLALASYRVDKVGTVTLNQQNVFAFYGTGDTCFELHLSKTGHTPSDKPFFDAALNTFHFEPDYTPTPADYGVVATVFFNYIHDFPSARIYYQRTYDSLPKADLTAPTATPLGRITVIQLSTVDGLTGDLAAVRAVNNAAIARDPDFPMYFYDLACADAEQGDAAAARNHLQQAFDRRHNMLHDLPMPDPTQDESLSKLKSDTAFWSFVQSLPRDH